MQVLIERCNKQIRGECECTLGSFNELSYRKEGEKVIIYSKKNSECPYYHSNKASYNIPENQYSKLVSKLNLDSSFLPVSQD
jgi:hypothetical protein